MAIHIDMGLGEFKYSLAADKGDNKTVFTLQPMTGEQVCNITPQMTRDSAGQIKIDGPGVRQVLNYGLKGWTGLYDQDGKEIEFSKEMISKLPYAERIELAVKIFFSSQMAGDVRGN
jgi:hypothetical protein